MNQRETLEGLQLLYQRVDQEHRIRLQEWDQQLAIQTELSQTLLELNNQRQAISKAIEVMSHG
jgi:hypothetical protein